MVLLYFFPHHQNLKLKEIPEFSRTCWNRLHVIFIYLLLQLHSKAILKLLIFTVYRYNFYIRFKLKLYCILLLFKFKRIDSPSVLFTHMSKNSSCVGEYLCRIIVLNTNLNSFCGFYSFKVTCDCFTPCILSGNHQN